MTRNVLSNGTVEGDRVGCGLDEAVLRDEGTRSVA